VQYVIITCNHSKPVFSSYTDYTCC